MHAACSTHLDVHQDCPLSTQNVLTPDIASLATVFVTVGKATEMSQRSLRTSVSPAVLEEEGYQLVAICGVAAGVPCAGHHVPLACSDAQQLLATVLLVIPATLSSVVEHCVAPSSLQRQPLVGRSVQTPFFPVELHQAVVASSLRSIIATLVGHYAKVAFSTLDAAVHPHPSPSPELRLELRPRKPKSHRQKAKGPCVKKKCHAK